MEKMNLLGYSVWTNKKTGEPNGRFGFLRESTPVDNQMGKYGQVYVENWIPRHQISLFNPSLVGKEFTLDYVFGYNGPIVSSVNFVEVK